MNINFLPVRPTECIVSVPENRRKYLLVYTLGITRRAISICIMYFFKKNLSVQSLELRFEH